MHDSNSQAGARDLPAVSSTSARLLLSRGQVTDARTEAEAGSAAMEAGGSREFSADLVACAALTTWLGQGRDAALDAIERFDGFAADHAYGMNHVELVRVLIDGGHDSAATRRLTAPIIAVLATPTANWCSTRSMDRRWCAASSRLVWPRRRMWSCGGAVISQR
jgi:hypothetical protein